VRVLLDTHIFLWWNSDPRMISGALREAIAESGNEIYVSAASVWEVAIKRALGKLAFTQRIVQAVLGHRFELLPINGEHAEYAAELPPHHGDPFDRMLIAQAYVERKLLGTQDAKIRPYGVATLGLEPSRR
jgi:PIN domain nuclease of toxin-antitoxin system